MKRPRFSLSVLLSGSSKSTGSTITLTASDGFKLGGYRADPQGKPKGGLVVIQEIFGVNHHIRNVCDRFAAQGYKIRDLLRTIALGTAFSQVAKSKKGPVPADDKADGTPPPRTQRTTLNLH